MSANRSPELVGLKGPITVTYQPKHRLMVVDYPRQGKYLYQHVTERAYTVLMQSPMVLARFIEDQSRHLSVIAST